MAQNFIDNGGNSNILENVVVLPLRNQVVFPSVRSVIDIGKGTFQELCNHLEKTSSSGFAAVALRPAKAGSPPQTYEVGTYCRLNSHTVAEDNGNSAKDTESADAGFPNGSGRQPGRVRLVVDPRCRFRILKYTEMSPIRKATVQFLEEQENIDNDTAVRALAQSVQDKFNELLKQGGKDLEKMFGKGRHMQWPSQVSLLASIVGVTLTYLSVEERQQILEAPDVKSQLEVVLSLLQREAEAHRLTNEISTNIQKNREIELRQVILQRQIQEVQKNLQKIRTKSLRDEASQNGESSEGDSELPDEEEDEGDEAVRLKEKISKLGLTEDSMRVVKRELKHLKNLKPHHPEYTGTHTYLELISNLPWNVSSEDRFDLRRAQAILNEDHRGLEKVKTRILEFLAVQKLRGNMKGPILCLHGPPGIGKTSLGQSIARALGRKFHRIALGGVRDEAELRGHRRTYIGSIPGVIIQTFQAVGVNNPVILLDEIDKMAQTAQFNPQATLLEVLDPEQNDTFKDHYLNLPFDLSKVLFICTANDSSLIDRPLLDRMEVIELSGYTVDEKVAITKTHLLPKQRRLHALESETRQEEKQDSSTASSASSSSASDASDSEQLHINQSKDLTSPMLSLSDDAAVQLITKWTSESGVRTLERRLAQLCRWAALRLQQVDLPSGSGLERDAEREEALASSGPHQDGSITIDSHHLQHIIGVELFEPNIAERLSVGVAMGLSVSTVGGQLLFIEATRTSGKGRLTITGQLGKVMTESVDTALSLLKSKFVRASRGPVDVSSGVLNLLLSIRTPNDAEKVDDDADRDPFKGEDIHVHFPAGGIPKDGPSAGVAVFLALASLLLNQSIRSDTAVTGEITLRGHVLPVGGIRDKVLAAHRAGVRHVLLPLANKRNVLEDIPAKALKGIEVHYIKHVHEALDWVFGKHQVHKSDATAFNVPSSFLPDGVPAAMAAARNRAGHHLLPPRAKI